MVIERDNAVGEVCERLNETICVVGKRVGAAKIIDNGGQLSGAVVAK